MERGPASVGEILSTFEALRPRLCEYRIYRVWNRVVGRKISERAQPSGLKGSTLYVTVSSSSWMQELSLFKGQIIKGLNESLGEERVEEIVFRLGRLGRRDKTSARESISLPEETERRIGEIVRPLKDPELRGILQRLLEKDAILKSKGR